MIRQAAPFLRALVFAVLGSIACKRAPSVAATPEKEGAITTPSTSASKPPVVDVIGVDHSGLALKGPIPAEGGGAATQHDARYAALPYGIAEISAWGGLWIHLTATPVKCDGSMPGPPSVYLQFHTSAGPDRDFFTGRVTSAHLDYVDNYLVHTRIDPFALVAGAHVKGVFGYSDRGSGGHNGFVITPSRGAGAFDVTLCPFDPDVMKALTPPAGLSLETPFSWTIDGVAMKPKSTLIWARYDDIDVAPYVYSVQFFEEAGLDCDHYFASKGKKTLAFSFGMEAADLGVAQPALFAPDALEAPTQREPETGWARIDSFDLLDTKVTTASGSVVGWVEKEKLIAKGGPVTVPPLPEVRAAGHFEATLCRLGSRYGKPWQ